MSWSSEVTVEVTVAKTGRNLLQYKVKFELNIFETEFQLQIPTVGLLCSRWYCGDGISSCGCVLTFNVNRQTHLRRKTAWAPLADIRVVGVVCKFSVFCQLFILTSAEFTGTLSIVDVGMALVYVNWKTHVSRKLARAEGTAKRMFGVVSLCIVYVGITLLNEIFFADLTCEGLLPTVGSEMSYKGARKRPFRTTNGAFQIHIIFILLPFNSLHSWWGSPLLLRLVLQIDSFPQWVGLKFRNTWALKGSVLPSACWYSAASSTVDPRKSKLVFRRESGSGV